jgi:NAD(P)H-dependent flavin oxidoreductase YrpB (nitropropane dioxygenase family)
MVVMNMVGAVKHVPKALAMGVDIICAQGGEGGGHTGEIPTSVLLPKVVDACRGTMSPLTGEPVIVVGAGGIFDGRGLASSLSCGAAGVWVGTRFIACTDANAGPHHKKLVAECGYSDTVRTLIYTGRPARCFQTPFVKDWHENRAEEMNTALAKGIVPVPYLDEAFGGIDPLPEDASFQDKFARRLWLMGQCAGAITEEDIKPAKDIVEEMVADAAALLNLAHSYVLAPSKL